MLGFSFGLIQMALYVKYKDGNKISTKQKVPAESVLTQVVVIGEPNSRDQVITVIELKEEVLHLENTGVASPNDGKINGVEGLI